MSEKANLKGFTENPRKRLLHRPRVLHLSDERQGEMQILQRNIIAPDTLLLQVVKRSCHGLFHILR